MFLSCVIRLVGKESKLKDGKKGNILPLVDMIYPFYYELSETALATEAASY